jgi:hypothetical protein
LDVPDVDDDAYGERDGREIEIPRPAAVMTPVNAAARVAQSSGVQRQERQQPSGAPRVSVSPQHGTQIRTGAPLQPEPQQPLISRRQDSAQLRGEIQDDERDAGERNKVRADDLDVPTFLRRQAQKA